MEKSRQRSQRFAVKLSEVTNMRVGFRTHVEVNSVRVYRFRLSSEVDRLELHRVGGEWLVTFLLLEATTPAGINSRLRGSELRVELAQGTRPQAASRVGGGR